MNKEISVIIPVYNCPEGLRDTVESLIDQDYPKEKYEIIIADNGSNDDTFTVVNNFIDRFPNLVQVVIEDNIQSSYAARNKGIEASGGDILCFIDADMTVKPDYLSNIEDYFNENSVDYLGCNVNIYTNKNTLTAKYNLVNGFPVKSYLESHHFVPTCCLSIKRSVIEKVGYFDNRLESSGDMEFGHRVYDAGLKQIYVEKISANHPARWRYKSLISKAKRVARGIAQLSHYYPEKYGYLCDKYFTARFFLPTNPLSHKKKFKSKGIDIGLCTAIIISFIHLPLRISALLELMKFKKYHLDCK